MSDFEELPDLFLVILEERSHYPAKFIERDEQKSAKSED
jgi:hypothetical protein